MAILTEDLARELITALNHHSDVMERFIVCTNAAVENDKKILALENNQFHATDTPEEVPLLDTPVLDLDLSYNTRKKLHKRPIYCRTLGDIINYTWPKLCANTTLGRDATSEIFQLVTKLGLQFKDYVKPDSIPIFTDTAIDPTVIQSNHNLPATQRATNLLQALGICPISGQERRYGQQHPIEDDLYEGYAWLRQVVALAIEQAPNDININAEIQEIATAHGLNPRQVTHRISQRTGLAHSMHMIHNMIGLPIAFSPSRATLPQIALLASRLAETGKI